MPSTLRMAGMAAYAGETGFTAFAGVSHSLSLAPQPRRSKPARPRSPKRRPPRRNGSGYVFERDLILNAFRLRQVQNLVFLTGEVHHAELIRHEPWPGWAFHEFSAGPLAARQGYPRPLDRSLRSRSLGSLGWTENFGQLDADGDTLRVKIVDGAGETRVALRVPAQSPVRQARR